MDGYTQLTAAFDQAHWAASAAIAAWVLGFLTLVLNGAGLFFIYGQLRLNRRSIEVAEMAARAAVADVRPWLNLEVDHAATMRYSNGEWSLSFRCKAQNKGRTVAAEVACGARPMKLKQFRHFTPPVSKASFIHHTLFPDAEPCIEWLDVALAEKPSSAAATVAVWFSYGQDGASYHSMALVAANGNTRGHDGVAVEGFTETFPAHCSIVAQRFI